MVAKLATPSFVAGAKDELATADVYTQTQETVINSIPEEGEAGFDEGELLGLRGGKAMLGEASLKLKSALPSVNLGELGARVQNAASEVTGGMRDMTGAGSEVLLGDIGASLPQYEDITTTVGDATAPIAPGASFTDVKAVGGMIGGLSGDPSSFTLNDRGALVGTLSGVISSATKLGIPNAFGEVMKYQGMSTSNAAVDKRAINQIAARVIPDVLRYSDLSSLSSIAQTATAGALRMLNPNLVGDFASGYRAPANTRVSDHGRTYNSATTTFTQIDPNWNQASRGGQMLPSITSMQGASKDMQKVFQVGALLSTVPADKLQLLAARFRPQTVDQSLKERYPATCLADDYRVAEKPLDPRLNDSSLEWIDTRFTPAPIEDATASQAFEDTMSA